MSGLQVVLAGSYSDDEPGSPWRVCLYVDERATPVQREALTEIFLGRAGGTTLQNFASAIGQVYAVRAARITLDHTRDRQRIRAGEYVTVLAKETVPANDPIMCGIPGFDHPGQELQAAVLRVNDPPLRWEVRGKASFATHFAYNSST